MAFALGHIPAHRIANALYEFYARHAEFVNETCSQPATCDSFIPAWAMKALSQSGADG